MLTRLILNLILVSVTTIPCQARQLPGSSTYPDDLIKEMESRITAMGPDYTPRTEHLDEDGKPVYTNRLILEDSPYLIQHAHNPVNWYAWGEKPFAVARQQDKPVFLSVGYSTCHWCHVMERESFDNEKVAKFMNENFISIKVDRERRPDVDNAYMTAVTMITGRGGWPMSAFLTPDGKPFFGGTYFPPDDFLELLRRVHKIWSRDRTAVQRQASELQALVENRFQAQKQARTLDKETVRKAVKDYLGGYDPLAGGFGETPKFPQEPVLLFLLQHAESEPDSELLAALEHTLQMMARGGINDQIGGGFHRYSTDGQWLVPHFEKMLYNQAHIARAYLLLYRITGKEEYARTARHILDYVAREMTAPRGGFYSATDADSEGGEGRYFVWNKKEIINALSEEDARLAIDLFGVTESGNFSGSNVLSLPVSPKRYAKNNNVEYDVLLERIDANRTTLYQVRKKRIPPLQDKKILTAWNGMMVTSYTMAAWILNHPGYLDRAISAAEFILANQWQDNNLQRVYLNGRSSQPAKQDDYAYMIQAFISLYDTTRDRRWLHHAENMTDSMVEKFHDRKDGGFLMSTADDILYIEPHDVKEGAVPSGNGIALLSLARLYDRTGKQHYKELMLDTLNAINNRIDHPTASPTMLTVIDDIRSQPGGNPAYGARGNIRAAAEFINKNDKPYIKINLDIAKGWHINSNQSRVEDIIPTRIGPGTPETGWIPGKVSFPPPVTRQFSFVTEPLDVFEGRLELTIPMQQTGDSKVPDNYRLLPLTIHYQACNDSTCLAPETLRIMAAH